MKLSMPKMAARLAALVMPKPKFFSKYGARALSRASCTGRELESEACDFQVIFKKIQNREPRQMSLQQCQNTENTTNRRQLASRNHCASARTVRSQQLAEMTAQMPW